MQITSSSNNIYTSNTNNTTNTQEVDKKYKDNAIPRVEELLDEEGMTFLNNLLSDMSYEDQNFGKLFLSFQLSIKSESVINGKLHIERETATLDSKSIENKLDLLIAKSKDRKGEKTELVNYLLNELKSFYANKNEINNITRADSAIDDFLEELYNTNSIESASALVKEDMKSKVDEYAQTLDKELNDTQRSEMINEYKQELLKEYKDVLESSTNDKMTLQQQAIMKALLDENTKEASYLESLLSQKSNFTQSKDSTNNGANYYMESLDANGNEIMNNILSGRSDTEKFAIKGVLDRILSIKVNMNTDGSASISTQKFINKNTVLSNLDEYINNAIKSSDKYGILEVAIEFKSQYEALI